MTPATLNPRASGRLKSNRGPTRAQSGLPHPGRSTISRRTPTPNTVRIFAAVLPYFMSDSSMMQCVGIDSLVILHDPTKTNKLIPAAPHFGECPAFVAAKWLLCVGSPRRPSTDRWSAPWGGSDKRLFADGLHVHHRQALRPCRRHSEAATHVPQRSVTLRRGGIPYPDEPVAHGRSLTRRVTHRGGCTSCGWKTRRGNDARQDQE
jgi:hypothetical protein